jgi:ATP-dependent helicase HrpB
LPLTLELLSPAQRPIQTTRDLPGFWKGSWADVRSRDARTLSTPSVAGKPRQAAPDTGPSRAARGEKPIAASCMR